MTNHTEIGSTTLNLPEPPARCPEADSIRARWYAGEPAAGDELRYHTARCYPCLRYNAWSAEAARRAVHPDLSAEEIEGI